MPIGCPVFSARMLLLRLSLLGLSLGLRLSLGLSLLLLLLAHALELLVDLLRRLDSVGRVRLSGAGGRCVGGCSRSDWRSSPRGWALRLR